MLVQTSRGPRYARGTLRGEEDVTRIALQHLTRFWLHKVPAPEGRVSPLGHSIDPDEVADPLDAADTADQHEPEAQGGQMAAQQGEFLPRAVSQEPPCITCSNLWCAGVQGDEDCVKEIDTGDE